MKTLLRLAASALVATFLVVGTWTAAEAQTDPALVGGWVIADWEAAEGQTGPTPQRGLFIFTESGHYSIMYVIGDARADTGADPSDADLAAAYRPFVANSGRYMVSGNEVTYEAFMAKDPAYMSRFAPTGGEGNAQTFTYTVGDGTVTLKFGEGGPMSGATATLRRPGTGGGN